MMELVHGHYNLPWALCRGPVLTNLHSVVQLILEESTETAYLLSGPQPAVVLHTTWALDPTPFEVPFGFIHTITSHHISI